MNPLLIGIGGILLAMGLYNPTKKNDEKPEKDLNAGAPDDTIDASNAKIVPTGEETDSNSSDR